MKLWDYIDVTKLEERINCGLVTCRWHDDYKELMILSYGRAAVLSQHWDEITCSCRGLIVDMVTGDVIARPFEKFFDADIPSELDSEVSCFPPDEPIVLEKINGSLGILYHRNGTPWIASKSSFHSEHAMWATNWYRQHVAHREAWPIGYTPVFEMVCQKIQPHTVQYAQDGLFLIGLVHIDTGAECNYGELCFWAAVNGVGIPRRFNISIDEALRHNRGGEEGYVCTWLREGTTPRRVRIKFPEFLRRRALFNRLTKKMLLEQLRDYGVTPKGWLDTSMPHLIARVARWRDELWYEYERIFTTASGIMREALKTCTTRKEYAAFFNQEENKEYAPVCFAIRDERDYKRAIWKMIEETIQ